MRFKSKALIVSFLVVFFISMGSIAANDTNIDNNLTLADSSFNHESDELISIDNKIDNSLNAKDELPLESKVITVGNKSSLGNDTIQDYIDNASAGDTIVITGDYYNHAHLVIDKKLTIISNVQTSLETCPGNIGGSGFHGIFYITPKGSGTIIDGFTLENDVLNDDDYGILVKGASNVILRNCIIKNTGTSDAIRIEIAKNINISNMTLFNAKNGIRIKESENVAVENSVIRNSTNGIYIVDSIKSRVEHNDISYNKNNGVYVGENNVDTTIIYNNITYNKAIGVNIHSSQNVYVLSNYIAHNRNGDEQSYKSGAGVYVNCNVTKIEIKGNLFVKNGLYAILNDYRVRNIGNNVGDEQYELIENNYIYGHGHRPVYHVAYFEVESGDYVYDAVNDVYNYVGPGNGNYEVGKTTIYLGYTFEIGELICPTYYFKYTNKGPHVWGSGDYYLRLSEITQIKKGVYSISIVDANGNIAKDISSVYVNFYLNKNNIRYTPQAGDVYKTVLMQNGTAIVKFDVEDFNDTGNVLLASFPGLTNNVYNNPYKEFAISDSDIPGVILNTTITVENMNTYLKSGEYFTAKLTDANNALLSNKTLSFRYNSDIIPVVTDENGEAKIKISESKETAITVDVAFDGDDNYYASSSSAKIVIKKETAKIISSDVNFIPKMSENYMVTLKDINGNPLAGEKISFKVNGKTYTRKTDSKGQAKVNLKFTTAKTYKISIRYAGSNKYKSVEKNNKIKVKYSSKTAKLSVPTVTIPPKTSKSYTVSLKNADGKGISKQKITVKVNGKTYTKKTNSKGQVKLNIKFNKIKSYAVKANYKGSKIYKKASASGKIKVAKESTKFIASDFKAYPNEGKSYVITLKSNSNSGLSKQKVSIKIGSKTYTKTTDSKGQASINVNLPDEGTYLVTLSYNGNSIYKNTKYTTKINIEKDKVQLDAYNRTYSANSISDYFVALKDNDGNPLANQKITFEINGNSYDKLTDDDGYASIKLDNAVSSFEIASLFNGTNKYSQAHSLNKITVLNKTGPVFIDGDLPNAEIQKILDESNDGDNVEFLGNAYSDISLIVKKQLNIYSSNKTTLNSKLNCSAFKILSSNVTISDFNIVSSSNSGIIIDSCENICILNNLLTNELDQSKMKEYLDSTISLPGYGISVLNSNNVNISQNSISYFESAIFAENSSQIKIDCNHIHENNYGVKYGFDVVNTIISDNEISENIGLYALDIPEGPRGYGIFLNNSGVNVSITNNHIVYNHLGISIDSNYTNGIVITSNCISDNVLEGIRFNAGYDLAKGAVGPYVTDNAIYRNARGPSMMILGELSANPEGRYGPGQWNDSLKLPLDANWYGTNTLSTWDNDTGIVGVGTMCPRIKTYPISFDGLDYNGVGNYSILFYKDGVLDTNLAKFDLYATLNRGTDFEIECHFNVMDGVGNICFNNSSFKAGANIIEISVGSLINSPDRTYTTLYTYFVPDEEILG